MPVSDILQHFSLTTLPFARAVPPGALLEHKSFSEALSRLKLALDAKSPAVLTAEPGLGKSTLLAALSDGLDPGATHLVYTPLCACGPYGLIGQLAQRYGAKQKRTTTQTALALLEELSRSQKRELLILDDAHRLPAQSLDELRLLLNLDFDRASPFCLLLVGQPSLRERLAESELSSLSQRLSIRAQLSPLSENDTMSYLDHRLRAAGTTQTLFRPAATEKLFERSLGIPRLINNLATASLIAAATAGKKQVELAHVEQACFDQEHV